MHKCLSAERSYINVETEPRTYLCGGGGGSLGGQLGGVTKLFFGRWRAMAKYFLHGWQIGGGMRCITFLGVGCQNIFEVEFSVPLPLLYLVTCV